MRFVTAFLFVASCTALNPAFDPPSDGPIGTSTNDVSADEDGPGGVSSDEPTAAEPTSTGAGGSTSSSLSGEGTTYGTTGGSGETGSESTAAEGGPSTGSSDETGVLCPDCAECETCVDGVCVPAAGGACSQPVGLACELKLWGLDVGTGNCLAYQAEQPVCVAPGVCDYPCAAPGGVAIDCHEGCVLPNHGCGEGTPVAAVPLQSVCITDYSQTPGCGSTCVYEQGFPNYELRNCNPEGQCAMTNTFDCQYNACSDAGGCSLVCESNAQCTAPAVCNTMTKMCVLT